MLRCLLSLRDETVKQNHAALLDAEDDLGDASSWQLAAHFPEFAAERAQRKLNVFCVLPDHLAVLCFKTLQPLPHGLASRIRALGMDVLVAPTIMGDEADRERLARQVLELATTLRRR